MKHCLLTLGFFIWGTVSLAQEATPTLDSTIYASVADVVFPMQTYGELVIDLPASEVARVTLTINAPNNAPVVINFPGDEPFFFAKEYVEVRYVWQIPPQTPPPLFSEIVLQWQIVTTRDREIFQEESVMYTDKRVNWQTIELEDTSISLTVPDDWRVGRTLESQILPLYTRLREHTGNAPRLNLLVYPSNVPVGCDVDAEGKPVVVFTRKLEVQTIACDVATAQRSIRNGGYETLAVPNETFFFDALQDALIQGAYAPVWQNSNVSAWLQTGMRRFYKPFGVSTLFDLRQTLRLQRAFTLSEMLQPAPEGKELLWGNQAHSMVLFLADTFGVPTLIDLARGDAEESFESRFLALSGASTEGLVVAWQAWLYNIRAEQTYGYNVFALTTLTPTVTPSTTPTRLRATALPTATPTTEATVTPTLTRTPRPPTPTITPLPAESFSLRPTAIPNAPTTNNSNTGGLGEAQAIILAVGMVLMAIVGAAGLYLTRKQ